MSSIISSGPIASAAGIANSVAGMVKAFTKKPTLMQFEFNDDDPAYSATNSNLILAFDAIMTDTMTRQSQPTAFPIEDASSITDHITRLPLQIDLVGIVTDTPIAPSKALFQQEAVTTVVSAILPPLGVVGAGAAAGFINGTLHDTQNSLESRPSRKALEILEGLQIGNPNATPPRPPKPFTATSRMGRWRNMMVANLVVPRDEQTGDSLVFQVSLVQVIVVQSQQVPLTNLANSVLAAAKRNVGSQRSPQVTDSKKEDGLGEELDDLTEAGKRQGRKATGYQPADGGDD